MAKASQASTTKDRSPNYPAVEFTFCLDKVRKLYAQEKHHQVAPEIALKHMGNGSYNGYARTILGAMKQYGLIESTGGGIRVSDDGAYIIVYPEGEPKRTRLLRELPLRPKIFQQIVARFPPTEGLPSDANLSGFLQLEMNFTKDACPKVIKALRHALKVSQAAGAPSEDSNEGAEESADASRTAPVAIPMASSGPALLSSQAAPRPGQPSITGYQSRTWKLDDKVMLVSLPPDLTRRDVEKMKKYIAALEAEAMISWEDSAEDE